MRVDDGSTASTATRCPAPVSRVPSASMKVDFPTPGTPLIPTRCAPPACGSSSSSSSCAAARWSARWDSTRVIARASVAREPSSTPLASAGTSGHDRRGPSALADSDADSFASRSTAASAITVPGPNTAAAPASCSAGTSAGGITPPTTTMMSGRSRRASSARSSGTRVRCPAASEVTPTTCTSASTAWRATSAGVWNSGPTSTSKPRSANAVAITFWPRSWPSWPILATRIRGWRPSSAANSSTSSRARAMAGLAPASFEYTPEMIRIWPACRPNTFSSASEISPTVAFARAAATDRASRFSSSRAGRALGDRRRGVRQRRQGGVDGAVVALLAQPAQLGQLLGAHPGVVDLEHVDLLVDGGDVLVDPDHGLAPGVDPGLGAGRGLLDPQLRDAGVDGLRPCPPAFSTSAMCAQARRARS